MTIAHQAPLSVGFSRQEYWSGLPCPSPGNLSDPGSPILQADSLLSEPLVTADFQMQDLLLNSQASWNQVSPLHVCLPHL